MIRKALRPLALCLATCGLAALLATGAAADTTLDSLACRLVAARYGVPYETLSVANSAKASFPLQDLSVLDFKVVDSKSAAVYGIALDDAGAEVAIDELRQKEGDLAAARFGGLEPELADAIARVPKDQPLDVQIWVKRFEDVRLERPPSDRPLSPEQVQEIYAGLDSVRSATARAATQPFVEKLAALEIKATTNDLVPVVSAQIPAGRIEEIAALEGVDQIYLGRVVEPLLDVAAATTGAASVHGQGNFGQGVRVAALDVGGRVAAGNPNLSVFQDPTFVCAADSSHSTAVAGIIGSWDPTFFGIAPSAMLRVGGSCAGWDSEIEDRATAAQAWGASALNLSLGTAQGTTVGAIDRFFDEVVLNGWRSVLVAAGNNGMVASPARGYNLVAVGNYDDRNTVAWGDDGMSPATAFIDPASTHGDREKPEVAAPGTLITSTSTAAPWNNFTSTGTSYAAPMVTGIVALMTGANGTLAVWPEGVKAILMATALHNIEGDTRLSDMDGAGGVDAERATAVARGLGGNWATRAYSCGDPGTLDVDSMALQRLDRVRVAIAWDTNTYAWNAAYANEPTADLDLQVLDPSGVVVATSLSFDNTYEIVDFTARTSGVYTLRVSKFRCDHDPKWLGWAWYHERSFLPPPPDPQP